MDHHSWRPSSRWGARSSSGELEPQGSSSAPPWDATGHGDGRGGEFRSHPRPPSRAYLRPPLASRRRGRGPGLAMAGEGIGECSVLLLGGAPRPPSCSRGGVVARVSGGQRRSTGGWQKALGSRLRGHLSRPSRASSSCVRLVPLARAGRCRRGSAGPPPSGLHFHPEARRTRRSWSRRPGRRGRVRASGGADVVGVASTAAASCLALLPRPPGRLASRPPRDVDWSRVTAPRVASVATASAPATGSSFLPPSASSLHQNPPSALTKPLRFANQTFTTLAFL